MSSANFKLKRTAAASCGVLATARFSCSESQAVKDEAMYEKKILPMIALYENEWKKLKNWFKCPLINETLWSETETFKNTSQDRLETEMLRPRLQLWLKHCVECMCTVLLWARWPIGRLLPAEKQPHPDGFRVTQIEPRSGETFSKQAVNNCSSFVSHFSKCLADLHYSKFATREYIASPPTLVFVTTLPWITTLSIFIHAYCY